MLFYMTDPSNILLLQRYEKAYLLLELNNILGKSHKNYTECKERYNAFWKQSADHPIYLRTSSDSLACSRNNYNELVERFKHIDRDDQVVFQISHILYQNQYQYFLRQLYLPT